MNDKNFIDMLLQCMDISSAKLPYNIEELMKKSDAFPIPFPLEAVRVKTLKKRVPLNKLKRNIISTYCIIHERVLVLMTLFLTYKRDYGSDMEKLYYKNMTVPQFLNRILLKRSAFFLGSQDWYLLLTGEKGISNWENVGTSTEKHPLVLENCLSYDEMKLSAMVYVSGYTECINDGNRQNNGIVAENNIEEEAVVIGLIGPRFLRRTKMDYQDIIIAENQDANDSYFSNIFKKQDATQNLTEQSDDGLRQIWSEFYQSPILDFNDLHARNTRIADSNSANYTNRFRYVPGSNNTEIFDNQIYYRRISIIAETGLIEAESRAKESGRNAFINVIGCGLGVWMISPHQSDIYILTFIERARTFLNIGLLDHITDINFAFIQPSANIEGMFTHVINLDNQYEVRQVFLESETHPNGGINIQMANRQPSSKLTGEHEGKLLVIIYPGDSNALPGNEFWFESFNTSGGAAAACSTQISELHNAHINPAVSGYNVRVIGREDKIAPKKSRIDVNQDPFFPSYWCKKNWNLSKMSDFDKEFFKQSKKRRTSTIPDIIEKLIQHSKSFPIPFPIESIRLEKLKESRPIERLKRNILSTYPLIHEKVFLLMIQFLKYKCEHGSHIEKELYKDKSVLSLIDRILKKRAITFVGSHDKYKLISGEEGVDGWEKIGTPEQKPPLLLEDCLSYDEMKLSAMVYISGYTECINIGERLNKGIVNEDNIEEEAVIIGLIGPRFHRRGKMDYEDILITPQQNCPENGYGKVSRSFFDIFKTRNNVQNRHAKKALRDMWDDFYEVTSLSYEDAVSQIKSDNEDQCKERFVYVPKGINKYIFDNEVYYKRLCIIAESIFIEAEFRAKERGKSAFVNVIGCGLGAWMISAHQCDVYVLTFLERVGELLENGRLDHVADVNFAYVMASPNVEEIFSDPQYQDEHFPKRKKIFLESKTHPNGGINVQMENRQPSSKLVGRDAGKLLVLTYPWDSNAHPGNEFWFGSLYTSGDPAAACSTQVSELHNAHINPYVSFLHTRIVTDAGVSLLTDYCIHRTFTGSD
ncbi:unnamed protein product, partial [Brenthis ino]